jgi:hypothetical protein
MTLTPTLSALPLRILPSAAYGRMRIDDRPAAQRHAMNASQTAAAVWIVQSCRAVTVCFKDVSHVAGAQYRDISRSRLRSREAIPILHQPQIAYRATENTDADAATAELRSRTTFGMRHHFLSCHCNMADMRSHPPHRSKFPSHARVPAMRPMCRSRLARRRDQIRSLCSRSKSTNNKRYEKHSHHDPCVTVDGPLASVMMT